MKNHLRYSILITLALLVTISLVYAQPPIGTTHQSLPYESSPSNYQGTSVGTVIDPTRMYDGSINNFGEFQMGSGIGSAGNMRLYGFSVPPDPKPFAFEWIDIKVKYAIIPAGAADDTYVWQIGLSSVGPWFNIMPAPETPPFALGIRAFTQLARPGGGAWTWADLGNLQLRVLFGKVSTWDTSKMDVWEVWASVYPAPLPSGGGGGGAGFSVQPPELYAYGEFFVDFYVQDVADMFSYEFTVNFDTAILTPSNSFTYWPWTVSAGGAPIYDDAGGKVYMAYTMPPPVPIGTAFTGNSPVCRIYFTADAMGICDLTIAKGAAETILGDSQGSAITRDIFDGVVRTSGFLSAVTDTSSLTPTVIDLNWGASPLGTYWHELYPAYSNTYQLTGYTDNGDGYLSTSDQITLTDATGTPWDYHVDLVTTTIHFTLKDFELGAKAEPTTPPAEPGDLGDPTGTTWHTIYGDDPAIGFCQTFIIDLWEDTNEDGVASVSDQFWITYDDPGLGGPYYCHCDGISTDMIVTPKPSEPPEFPLGIGLAMSLVALIPVIYVWRTRPKKKVE